MIFILFVSLVKKNVINDEYAWMKTFKMILDCDYKWP